PRHVELVGDTMSALHDVRRLVDVERPVLARLRADLAREHHASDHHRSYEQLPDSHHQMTLPTARFSVTGLVPLPSIRTEALSDPRSSDCSQTVPPTPSPR